MTTYPSASATPAQLKSALLAGLSPASRTWLDQALAAAHRSRSDDTPSPPHEHGYGATRASVPAPASPPPPGRPRIPSWELRFAEAGRRCQARTASPPNPPPSNTICTTGLPGRPHPAPTTTALPDLADAARVLLLHAADAEFVTVQRLYSTGTAAERRAVLMALPHLDRLRDGSALPLVEDALRANDTRLVAAAVGPYAAAHLPPHAWRHAVLKCLFTGVPVAAAADLARRALGDSELARMLTDYAAERNAAGRPVPADLHRVLALVLTDPARTAPSEES
ncbi:EboA domain-containing protein [Streptomyces sp. NPDC051561]|uniref:EboA domain-containing protein n=1 Tax=Streptomyces sp. NPDC051561 TaxID=3365658 RepID=UPI00378BDC87